MVTLAKSVADLKALLVPDTSLLPVLRQFVAVMDAYIATLEKDTAHGTPEKSQD